MIRYQYTFCVCIFLKRQGHLQWNLAVNEMPRDWGNLFVISRVCSIHFTVTLAGLENNHRSLYQGLRYKEVR